MCPPSKVDPAFLTMFYLYHEAEGEHVGHLRQREVPFYSFEDGEQMPALTADYSI